MTPAPAIIETPDTETLDIRNRWSGNIQFTATIRTGLLTPWLKTGAAVKWAISNGADLRGADLRDADLSDASLQHFKQDLIAEVLRLPNELEALRAAISAGQINGSSYGGQCACLAGTLAKAHGEGAGYDGYDIALGNVTFHADAHSPREQWFMSIKEGDTPETSPTAALALEWVNEAIAIRDNIRAAVVTA
jgi:hypothetical protein